MQPLSYSLRHQSGMVLIVSFIILLLLSIIGVSGMKVTGLEEKMAGNDRDQSIAFQAAETALRAAEVAAQGMIPSSTSAGNVSDFCSVDTPVAGLFFDPTITDGANCDPCPSPATGTNCDIPDPMQSATWAEDVSNLKSVPVTAGLLPNSKARYFITYHYYSNNKPSIPLKEKYYFTMTARGVGLQGGEVILRSYAGATIQR